jgi:hypothetical protein
MSTKIEITQPRKADIIVSTTESKASKAIFCLFMLLLLFMFGGCGTIYKTGFVPIPNQPISGPIEIGSEWVEIIPTNAIKPLGGQHWVLVKFLGCDFAKSPLNSNILLLKDGRTTQIEAFMFDNEGNSHELQISGFGGGGFQLYRTNEYFPLDKTYLKLKIRSQIPLKTEGIEWVSNISY